MKSFRTELNNSPFLEDNELRKVTRNRWAFTQKQGTKTRTLIAKRLKELGCKESDMRKYFPETLLVNTGVNTTIKRNVVSENNPIEKVPVNDNPEVPHVDIPEHIEEPIEEDIPLVEPGDEWLQDESKSLYDIISEEYPSSRYIDKPREKLLYRTYKIMKNPNKYGVFLNDNVNFVDIYNGLYNHEQEARRYKYGFLNDISGKKIPVVVPPDYVPAYEPEDQFKRIGKLSFKR